MTALIVCNYGIKKDISCPQVEVVPAVSAYSHTSALGRGPQGHRVHLGLTLGKLLATDYRLSKLPRSSHISHANIARPGWGRRNAQYGLNQGCVTAEQIALCQLHELSLFSAFLWIFSCHGSEDTCLNTQ